MTREWTRRQVLGVLGAAIGGSVLPSGIWLPRAAASQAAVSGFGGGRALRAAMHVHGSWSEGAGSWEAQFEQAGTNGYDVLYMTDHDHRALALKYMTSLTGVAWDPVISSGSFAQKTVTVSGGSLRLLAESARTAPASVTLPLQQFYQAFNKFRTSISGLTITQKITKATLSNGARYEVVLPLSYHPAVAGRPAGQYQLVYRFGGVAGRWTEGGGLVGVVSAPTPAPGSTQVLVPANDVAALWPTMQAIDNASYGLSFVAKSPKRTAICDVAVASMTFSRSRSTGTLVIADQQKLITAYSPRYPNMVVHAVTETSRTLPDMNPFGTGPWFPDYSHLSSDSNTAHQQIADQVHALGGVISYNHPFGYDTGPLLSPSARDAKRRQIFSDMQAVGRFGVDILEVGYNLRGQVDAPTHIALWDTFSRNGNFLTGNGTSDDHGGQYWRTLNNGFGTGVWSSSATDPAMVSALSGGRAFVAHFGRWPGGELDLLVDGTVPMGAVSVSQKAARSLSIWGKNLPAGAAIQVIGGQVDYAGSPDPGTWVKTTLSPSAFSGNVASMSVNTSTSRFFRVQVLDSNGNVLGTSNPVWLLRSAPPGGIPPARRVP